ncbi:hypothetical protein [Clostridium sp. KNHs216]|uniref:hypothetical protein n=1 Tax=Clostridium sp. KNHs216 TaxID=1550235 RepID=UPI00115428DC|nr:hypothetical protein [Clostridium sp. KNHs216]TQI68594.1 hypothetical protein LY85_3334 [Clostridium sp. KNHs216]
MKLKYVFFQKNKQGKFFPSKLFFSELFENVSKNDFEIHISKLKAAHITYQEVYNDGNNSCFLIFECNEGKKEFTARALNRVHKLLTKSPKRAGFLIVTVMDEVSEYYCSKAYPILGRFERKVRELVYDVVLKSFGSQWVHETNLPKKSESITDNQIQSGLDELTMFDMEEFLFIEYSPQEPNSIWSELSAENLQKMLKDEIIDHIEAYRPRTLWERLFSDKTEIIDLQDTLKKVRKYRNAVAHNKEFSLSDFMELKSLLTTAIPDLDYTIIGLEKQLFSHEDRALISARLSDVINQKLSAPAMMQASRLNQYQINTNPSIRALEAFQAKINSLTNSPSMRVFNTMQAQIDRLTSPSIRALETMQAKINSLTNSPSMRAFNTTQAQIDRLTGPSIQALEAMKAKYDYIFNSPAMKAQLLFSNLDAISHLSDNNISDDLSSNDQTALENDIKSDEDDNDEPTNSESKDSDATDLTGDGNTD